MTGGPGVSVVIVNHTRREELALTLKALEYQRYRRFEVVVVSDMDAAARPASPLGVRWVRFEERNISAARNLGIAAARGEVIAFIDDDAQPEFCWLEALVAAFDMPEVGAAGGWVRGRNGVSWQWRTVEVDAEGWDHPVESGEGMKVFAPRADRWVKTVGTNAAFRRVALAQAGGFDEAYRFFLDEVDLNRRVAEAGWSTAIVPRAEVLHGYAAGPHRTSRRVPRDLFEIGASQAAFVARTGTGEAVAREQTREQEHRLGRLFDLGLLSGRRRTWLLDRYRAGRTEGAAREVAIPPVAAAAAANFPASRHRIPVNLWCLPYAWDASGRSSRRRNGWQGRGRR